MSVATSSLRVPISTDYEAQTNGAGPDLQTKVLQIINQKGHFRHVTEQSLLAQDSDEEKDETDNIDQGGNEVEETPEKRDETLMKAREDMFRQMERAQNDTLVALEMVSFLLSKHSMPAQATMSDELKSRVPMGTLDSKVVEERQISEAKAKQFILTSRGWRSKTFELVSQALDSASDRMRVEAQRESKYWEQVARLRDSGVAISRYPRESHSVAVHFGSANSGPQFQQRGIALLRQDEDSNVYIDRSAASTNQSRMHVTISRTGQRTGAYTLNSRIVTEDMEVTRTILAARDELFVDELFHEISREARITANQGIDLRGQTISFDVEDKYQVGLSLQPTLSEPDSTLSDNPLAEYVGLALQSLLQQAHEQNYVRRTRIPSPLTTVPSPTLEYAILRPLVANLQHRVVVDELGSEANRSMLDPVRRAGLDIDWQTDSDDAEESKHEGATDDFISSNMPSRSLFCLVLPTRRKIKITVTSHLGSPIYGTQYEVSGLEYGFASIKQATHHKLETALSGLSRLLILDLCASIEDVPSKASETKEGRWKATRPHIGELVLPSAKSGKPIATMRVNLADGRLVLKIALARPEYTKGKKVLAWAWSHGRLSNAPVTIGQSDDIGIDEKVADKLDFREVVEKSLALSK